MARSWMIMLEVPAKRGEIVLLPALFFASKKGNEIMHKQSNILIAHPYVRSAFPLVTHTTFLSPSYSIFTRQPSHPKTHFRKAWCEFLV
jgi:hypothetical protein